MGRLTATTGAAATLAALAFTLGPAAEAGDEHRHRDHDRAREQVRSGEIRPLQEILENNPSLRGARVLEVELEREHGKLVYEIEILAPDGRVRELEFDAASGELIRRRDGD